MLKEEFKSIKSSARNLRNFGLVVGAVFVAFGVYSFYAEKTLAGEALIALGAMLIVFGALTPRALFWPYRVWMGFAVVMGWIMSRLILTIFFYVGILGIGLITRAFGKKFLDLNFKNNAKSYWRHREKRGFPTEDFEKQF